MQRKPATSTATKQGDRPQVIALPKRTPNRYRATLTPQMRQRIADECRVRGCVQTAKEYSITVGLALELRIEAIDRLLSEARARLAEWERKVAA